MAEKERNVRHELAELARSGPRKLSAFALWVLDHLDEVAFHSIRSLADAAAVDPNLVPRLSRAMGYDGYDDFRTAIQRMIQLRNKSYGMRARALRARKVTGVYEEIFAASQRNFDIVTSPANIAEIDRCVAMLQGARRIYTIGVRSCFSIAHYFSYVGKMAFENFVDVPSMPGAILDQMFHAGPEDVVVAITYEHYSAEVVRACEVARERGARVIAFTDAPTSPIAKGAHQTILLPMAGPQLMPSLISAILTVEMILASMAAQSEIAAERIETFENRIAGYGGYLALNAVSATKG